MLKYQYSIEKYSDPGLMQEGRHRNAFVILQKSSNENPKDNFFKSEVQISINRHSLFDDWKTKKKITKLEFFPKSFYTFNSVKKKNHNVMCI